jgi:hypothetical protein
VASSALQAAFYKPSGKRKLMKRLKIITAAAVVFVAGHASTYAQDTLMGKYSGNYEVQSPTRGVETRGMDLVIENIENGNVQGTVTRHLRGGGCRGATPVEGTLKDNQLVLKGKGGVTADCAINLRLVSQGNKLTGTSGAGERRVELSK